MASEGSGHAFSFCRRWIWVLVVHTIAEAYAKHTAYTIRRQFPLIDLRPLAYLGWTYSQNAGSAIGLFRDAEMYNFLLMHLFSLGVLFTIIDRARKSTCSNRFRWGVLAYTCGCLGNYLDRLTVGFVIDYLDFRCFHDSIRIQWNWSDMSINIGFVLLAVEISAGNY